MATPPDALSPKAYLEALAVAAGVLGDHAVALDRLGATADTSTGGWIGVDEAAGSDGSEPSGAGGPSVGSGVGSDLAATLASAVNAAEGCTDFASMCDALVRGARSASTGSAGRGTAELFEGTGEVLRNCDRLDAGRLALALEAAAERLAPADDGRHPGGFTAVVSVVADAALSTSDRDRGLADTLVAAADAGLEELERGPVSDQALAASGTVDAAAAGFLLVIDTLASVVTGEPLPARPLDVRAAPTTSEVTRFEVACRLIPDHADIEAAAHLESVLHELGDLRVWAPRGGAWTLRVVTPLPGPAVEAIAEVGRPRELHIGLAGGSGAAATAAGRPAFDAVG